MTMPNFLGSMTLKALLEDPNLKNPPIIARSSDSLKVKKEGDQGYPQYNYGSAFLGPNLWERTLDNSDFNLEYMDLDEFLLENGINGEENSNRSTQNPGLPDSPRQYLKTPPPLASGQQYKTPASPNYPAAQSIAASPQMSPTHGTTTPHPQSPAQQVYGNKSPTPPVSPLHVEFQVSDQDLALASIPDYGEGSRYQPKWHVWTDENGIRHGSDGFDPRRRNFSEEELKPQPIIKKSKKIFVPDNQKDDKYWARRHKNNFAAKRSRDARRVKENQIAMRAAYLEKENSCLKEEVAKLRKENSRLKGKVEKYEGPAGVEDIVGLPL